MLIFKGINMALKASVYKATVNLANLNTHYYEDIVLTMALHPSETEERLMYRLLAFLYSAHERLEFTVGLDNPELPDIWQKNYTDDIEHWIDIGYPDEKKIKKAIGRSDLVSIFNYNSFKAKVWFAKNKTILANKKVQVFHLEEEVSGSLEALAERSMQLNCMIEDDHIFLGNDSERIQINVITDLNELSS